MKKLSFVLFVAIVLFAFSGYSQTNTANLYPQEQGHLKFDKIQIFLMNVNNTDKKSDTLKVLNTFSQPMTLSFTKLPQFISCKAIPASLKPNQKGIIVVTYDASKRNDFGQLYDRFTFETNDSLSPEKQINISANIIEDFSKWTPEQIANAAKISFAEKTFDFGSINQGDKIEHDFVFSNTGKSDLIIRKTRGSCGCTVGTPEKSILKPGESSKIHVTFNSAGKSGQQSKTVTITCNDPGNAEAIITLTGTVNAPNPSNTH